MRSRRESGYGSQYSAANPLTTQRDMGRALTPYHSHGGNRSAAKEFDAYGIREGSLRPEQGYGYGRSQQEGSDRQQHFRGHDHGEGTEIIRSPNRSGRHATRNGNSRLDVMHSSSMRHASPGDNGANYYAEDVEVDAPSFDGRSSSGSRSYRTSEIGATFEDHVCTPSPYGPSPYKFGTAEWFRSKEDLFRQTGGKHGIPKGLPGISAADPGGRIKFARNPNYPGVKYGVPDGLPGMSSADPGGRLTSARRPNYLDSGARAWEAWKED